MRRRLPTPDEAIRILAEKRTRPPRRPPPVAGKALSKTLRAFDAMSDTWSTSITNYAQCKAHCPASGTLSHTGGISKLTVTVTFDGSANATWATSRGRSGTIALFCSP